MNVAQRIMDACSYDGRSRVKHAWLMAVATYTYTRAHDGDVVSDDGDTIHFSRWYCFCGAVSSAWSTLWRKP